MRLSEQNGENDEFSKQIKFRRSRIIRQYRNKNKYAKTANVIIFISLYLFIIDPLLFFVNWFSGATFLSFFQISFILVNCGVKYFAFYPYLFFGSTLFYIVFMISTNNRKKLKWLWVIFTSGFFWWIFVLMFSFGRQGFGL